MNRLTSPAADRSKTLVALTRNITNDIALLLNSLDEYLHSLYPSESIHGLDINFILSPSVRFFVARCEHKAVGCGGLKLNSAGFAEAKRMFVLPSYRGTGIGKNILKRIEQEAQIEKYTSLYLETGIHQPEAIGLYSSAGFVERGPFGGYGPDPLSVFMEKDLLHAV